MNSTLGVGARSVTIRLATQEDSTNWDAYVHAHHEGTFFHLFEWRKILESSFGLAPYYLVAERNDVLAGVLPLVFQRNLLFGRALISTAFCVQGGPLTADPEAQNALDEAACNLAHKLRATSLEYRSRRATRPGWQSKGGFYATFSKELFTDEAANLAAVPRKQRAVIRKALQSDLSSLVGRDVQAFFRVYSESMRNLGTPMFPRRYFHALLHAFPGQSDIVVIQDGPQPVAAVLNFYFKNTVLPYYGGGIREARASGANDLLYWEVMKHAVERGYRRFDFGRSKAGTGAFAFKKNWGFDPDWLEYEYYLPNGGHIPEKNPTHGIYQTLTKLWMRLPLPLANFIGPFLISGLG